MHSTGKIELLRNGNKRGVTISKDVYDALTNLILDSITSKPTGIVGLNELIDKANKLSGHTSVNVNWYLLQVKGDLQARNIIKVAFDPVRRQTIQINRRMIKHLSFSTEI